MHVQDLTIMGRLWHQAIDPGNNPPRCPPGHWSLLLSEVPAPAPLCLRARCHFSPKHVPATAVPCVVDGRADFSWQTGVPKWAREGGAHVHSRLPRVQGDMLLGGVYGSHRHLTRGLQAVTLPKGVQHYPTPRSPRRAAHTVHQSGSGCRRGPARGNSWEEYNG